MAASRIRAGNLSKKYRVDTRLVELIIKRVLKKAGADGRFNLEVQFVDDLAIRDLNRRFKGRDRTTDVLSFDLGGSGSIAISLDTARRNAKIFAAPVFEEVIRYVIHGILHLFGYDDDTPSKRLKMSAEEDRILGSICVNTDLSKVLTRL